jgi:hypothetical protein
MHRRIWGPGSRVSAPPLSPSIVFSPTPLLLCILQVKKMLGACGAAVAALHRERIGGLLLADYPELAVEGSVLILTLTLILT